MTSALPCGWFGLAVVSHDAGYGLSWSRGNTKKHMSIFNGWAIRTDRIQRMQHCRLAFTTSTEHDTVDIYLEGLRMTGPSTICNNMHARIYCNHEAQGPFNKEEGFRGDRYVYNLELFESSPSESWITMMDPCCWWWPQVHQENPLGYIDRCLKIGNYIVICSYYSHYSHYSGIL